SSNLRRKKNNNTTSTFSSSATSSLRDIFNGIAKDNISASFPIQKNHYKNSSMIPIGKINELDDLAVNIKKDISVHVSLAQLSTKIAEKTPEVSCQLSNKSQQQSAKSKKKIPEKSISKVLKASISSSTGKLDVMITDFSSISPKYTAIYNEDIKSKKLKAFDDSQTK
ncbi:13527_t:CDS:2, partial [Funneliformis mosseae]